MTNINSMLKSAGTLRYHGNGPSDEHNNPTDTWSEVTVACSIQQRSAYEVAEEGQLSSEVWLGYLPVTITPPRAADELVVEGTTYQLRGDSWLAHGTRGRADHIEATLVKAQ